MAKLISQIYTKGEYKDRTVQFPFVGEVQFDKNGYLIVPDDKAEAVIEATKDSFDFYDQKKPPVKTDEELEDEELINGLDKAKSSELLQMAVAAGLTAEQAAAMTDDMLKKVLISKVKEKKKK